MLEDKELSELAKIKAPSPSDDKKNHAIDSALRIFAENQESQKKQKNFQGFSEALRLIHSFNKQLWSNIMKKQLIAGTALASILVVGITVSMFNNKEHELASEFDEVASIVESPKEYEIAINDSAVQNSKVKKMQPASGMKTQQAFSDRARAASSEALVMSAGDMVQHHAILAPMPVIMPPGDIYIDNVTEHRDNFEKHDSNQVKITSSEPVSTFSIDVDTSSYAFVRRSINNGALPQKNAVRIEEMINYFDYNYPKPKSKDKPFEPAVAIYPTPWNKNTKLLHIGIEGHDILPDKKPVANLVFLLDVSGSMNSPDKLPLLKNAFKMLVENMNEDDTVSIVTYAGRSATVLEPTKASDKAKIIAALNNLHAGGGTAGEAGIKQAYALAEQNFNKEGVNRIILATDGDFNVGISNMEELKDFVERKRNSGVFLSVLGFGQGNYNDALMQKLAQNGNGNAAYIDNLNEARKVLVDEAESTIYPIASDVKIQIEFNPAKVAEYRLIGYESRILNREDFNNDKVDAGDIGSGHSVTAIYEITPAGSKERMVDNLRYGENDEDKQAKPDNNAEYAFLKLRYKLPGGDKSKLITRAITKSDEHNDIADISTDMQFAASVAAFGQILKGGKYIKDYSYDDIIALANKSRGEDEFGYRIEFINLVRNAKSINPM